MCGDLVRVANRTGIVILQHPRERFHPRGSAPLACLGLERCRLVVAQSGTERRVSARLQLPERTALLYPSADAIDLGSLGAAARPQNLLVLDGTWPQARRLFLDNPWLADLDHVRLAPTQASRYVVRRPPRPDCLSTLESILAALAVLEPETRGSEGLLRAFDAMNARQMVFMRAPDRRPRRQIRRDRVSRRLPAELFADQLIVVYAELEPTACTVPGRRDLVQFVAVRVADAADFEAIIRPRNQLPSVHQLHHLGIQPAVLAGGGSLAHARDAFGAFAGSDAVLGAWNRRTLELAREHLRWSGPIVVLKAAYTNLRGGKCGELADVLAVEGLTPAPLPFAGRAALRAGEALAVARWLRAGGGRSSIATADGAGIGRP